MNTTFAQLSPALLVESKTNARKRYNPKTLTELAESIKTIGVLQALLVRPLPCRFGYSAPVRPSRLIGFDSPLEFAAKSRTRKVCGFFVGTRLGGADGRAQALPVFAPRVPRSVNPSALPPSLTAGRQSFNGTLESIMANRITPVKFHGATLITIDINGVAHVALRPICEAIGLDWQAQHARILRHPVLAQAVSVTKTRQPTCVSVTETQVNGKPQARDMLVLPLDKLNGWLFGVNAARVRPELRDKLIQFQRECFDVLHNHFAGVRKMVAPPAPPPLRIEHDSKGITPAMAAAINARAMVILSSALPSIHQWLTDQVKSGCIAPGGGQAPNFEATLVSCDFAAFSTNWATHRLDSAIRLAEFAHAETARALANVQAERTRLATKGHTA